MLTGLPGALNDFYVDAKTRAMLDEARTWHIVR